MFFSKLHSKPVETLQFEHAISSALPFWDVDSVQEDLLLTEVEDETLSEKILSKIVREKKAK